MGSKTRLVTTSIKDDEIKTDNLNDGAITTAKIAADSVESSEINDGTVAADDLASTLDLSSKTVTLPNNAFNTQNFNISLLGFKMAVNESLTVFNLIDGIVDEFHDESGTDEAEGSNDNYCASNDLYDNISSGTFSAGFGLPASIPFACGSITEPTTSTIQQNNPQAGYTASPTGRVNIDQKMFTFTAPGGTTSVNIQAWGAGGGMGCGPAEGFGGGGGYAEGTLAVTGGQVLHGLVGYGGGDPEAVSDSPGTGVYANAPGEGHQFHLPGSGGHGGAGGGLSGVWTSNVDYLNKCGAFSQDAEGTIRAGSNEARTDFSPIVPATAVIAGAGGGASRPGPSGTRITGGAGGGLTGEAGGGNGAQTSSGPNYAGGGSQTTGGEGAGSCKSESFVHFVSARRCASGGGGFFAGGPGEYAGGGNSPFAGGGGSSYYGHPQITSGSTEGGAGAEGGGTAEPAYVASTNEGSNYSCGTSNQIGEQGYVLITGSFCQAQSTTIISNAFTANSVPTTSRIVVFEENVETPTINTDVIASISRDGGSTFTTATLSDSGYVTGSSGQRILTGQATISGQPSGQSMRWKLALANKQVKIHGVSLSWA
jgi:hypothetical protein